jgi:sterol desaturase/sphingolipid hydroxylase (fatty acid hydroxylase superfamily)
LAWPNIGAVAAVMQAGIKLSLAWKSLAVAAVFVVLFAAERWRPAAATHLVEPAWRRLLRNGALWAVNAVLSPIAVVPVSAYAASHALAWRPSWWSGPAGLLADLLLLDVLIYAWHRANHEVRFLWRFHSVHHLDRFLDTTSALRFHFGEVLLSALARAGVIVLLAIPLPSVLSFETLVLVAAMFHHSNLRLPSCVERALSLVVVTPSIHWVHHHRCRADTDANYCTVISLWDRLFRSRSGTARRPDMVIGVEGREETTLLALIAVPFLSF